MTEHTRNFVQNSGAEQTSPKTDLSLNPSAVNNIVAALSDKIDYSEFMNNGLHQIIEAYAAENRLLRAQLESAGDDIQLANERADRYLKSMDELHDISELMAEENIELSNIQMHQAAENQEYAEWAEYERILLREEIAELVGELTNADALIKTVSAELETSRLANRNLTQDVLELSKANHAGQLSQGDSHAELAESEKARIAVVQERNSLNIENDVLAAKLMTLDEQNRGLKEENAILEGLLVGEQFPEGYPDEHVPSEAIADDLEQAFTDGEFVEADDLPAYMAWLESNANDGETVIG